MFLAFVGCGNSLTVVDNDGNTNSDTVVSAANIALWSI